MCGSRSVDRTNWTEVGPGHESTHFLALVTQGLAPAPSLLHARVRECCDMGPTLGSRVSGPLGRRGVLVRAGFAAGMIFFTAVCYLMFNPLPDLFTSDVNRIVREPARAL